MGKMLDPLQERFAWRRRQKAGLALRTFQESPGRAPQYLPATSYASDSCKLLEEIQAHLLIEPDLGLTWDLWSEAEVLGYLNQRVGRFLVETGLVRKRDTSTTTSAVPDLPVDVLELRRVAWNGKGLPRADKQMLDWGRPGWQAETGTPDSYIEQPMPTLKITLVPAPSTSGTLDLLYVPKPEEITSTCVPLPIPGFLSWAIKWGVIADMLKKEGPANEPERAIAAETRFAEGVELAKIMIGAKS